MYYRKLFAKVRVGIVHGRVQVAARGDVTSAQYSTKKDILVEISSIAKRGLEYHHSKCWQWATSDCWPLRVGFLASLAV